MKHRSVSREQGGQKVGAEGKAPRTDRKNKRGLGKRNQRFSTWKKGGERRSPLRHDFNTKRGRKKGLGTKKKKNKVLISRYFERGKKGMKRPRTT